MDISTILSDAKIVGISMGHIERMAGFSRSSLARIVSGKRGMSRTLLLRVRFAVSRIKRGEANVDEAAPSACYRMAVAHVALFHGVEPSIILNEAPGRRATADKNWLLIAKMRRHALYIASVHLNIPGAELARAAGMSPAAISIALRAVEDERDDPDLERLFAPLERALGI